MEEKNSQNNKKQEKNTIWKGVFFLILSAFFFSLMSLFVRLSGDLPTFQKAFFRNIIAAIAAGAVLAKSKSFKMQKGSLPTLLLRSITGIVGVVANFYAIDNMPISDASILNKLAPFFTVIFSIVILKEKANWKDWLFVAIAFIGAIFVVKPSSEIAKSFPALIAVLGGVAAGMAYTFVRKLGKQGERNAFIVFFFSSFCTVAMLPFMIIYYEPMTTMQVVFLILAGCMAAGAQFSLTAAYTYAPAKSISVYDYIQVLFTALWGLIFLSELPDIWSFVGYVIIIGAAVIKYMVARNEDKKQKTE